MPRPRPPRKRPRKRPDAQQRVLRAEAALNKQTAQSTQQKPQPPGPPDAPRGASAAAPATGDELWSRRSYAVLVAIVAVLQLPITVIQWAVQPAAARGPVQFALLGLNPISLLIAALFAVPIAKMITREARTLRFMETLVVGIVIYFLWLVLAVPAGALISTTPAPHTSTTTSSSATATASPSPSNGVGSSTSASPSASASAGPATVIDATAQNYALFGVVNLAAFALTVYVYPPLYKRLRLKPRPRGPTPPRGSVRGQSKR